MGLYLLIIAIASSHFSGRYSHYDHEWRHSLWCHLAGALSVMSSEVSLLMILVMSVDRVLVLAFPFRHYRISVRQVCGLFLVACMLGFTISTIPVILSQYFKDSFYSANAVCLPVTTGTIQSHTSIIGTAYSVFIYQGLNSLILTGIIVCYTLIYRATREKGVGVQRDRKREVKLARNMALIILTDISCWLPISLIGEFQRDFVRSGGDASCMTQVTATCSRTGRVSIM